MYIVDNYLVTKSSANLVVVPSVGETRTTSLDTHNFTHLIETRICTHHVIVGDLIVVNDTCTRNDNKQEINKNNNSNNDNKNSNHKNKINNNVLHVIVRISEVCFLDISNKPAFYFSRFCHFFINTINKKN